MNPNNQNREDNTIVDLLKKPFTKKRSRTNHNPEKVKVDDSSIIHKPYKGLSPSADSCLGKRKNPSKDLSNLPSNKRKKIQDDHRLRTSIEKSALKKNDHCPQIHKPSKGLSREKKTQQQGVSTKMKIQNVKNVDRDASTTPVVVQKPRRLMKKLPTKDAECKHNGRINLELHNQVSMEKILVEDDDDYESLCKPLSECVVPGPVPDFDALDFDDSADASDFSQFFC